MSPRQGSSRELLSGPGGPGHQARGLRATARRGLTATALLAAVALACWAATLAACGSSGASDVPSATATGPTPAPSPQITTGEPPAAAVAVVREFWTLLGQGRDADAFRLTSPGSPLGTYEWGIASARFVELVPGSVSRGPAPNATVEFAVKVFIEPEASPAGGQWGAARAYQLFEQVVRLSDGTWRLVQSGTGP